MSSSVMISFASSLPSSTITVTIIRIVITSTIIAAIKIMLMFCVLTLIIIIISSSFVANITTISTAIPTDIVNTLMINDDISVPSSSSTTQATKRILEKVMESDVNLLNNNLQSIQMAEYPGDIMLGAIYPIHQHDTKNYSCGFLQMEGIQQLEAMIFILDRINNDPNILPGIRLGAFAIDSCDSPHHALEQAIDFIKSFVAKSNRRLVVPEFRCKDHSPPIYKDGHFDQIIGMIGGQKSEVSLQLANLLRLFHVPQVSYMSTSPTLSDERLYKYFFRTVPSDINQVDAIVDILRKFNWTYVSVVYSDTEYGNNGYDLLTMATSRYNICISSPQAINVERFLSIDYDNLITTLMQKTNARVVIVYTDPQVARKIMKAAKRRLGSRHSSTTGNLDRFVWIASDAWCCREFVVHGLEPMVEGTISVTPLHYPLDGFMDYFRSLQPSDDPIQHRLNPWFGEFWQQHFKCRLKPKNQIIDQDDIEEPFESNASTTNNQNQDSDSESKEYADVNYCNETLRLDEMDDLQQSPTLHFVRDAFYSFAMTLNQIHRNVCNGTNGLCDEMKRLMSNGRYFIEQLKKVEFRDEGGRLFRFQSNGDAPPRYHVVNFQRLTNGTYQWRPVGTYMIGENENRARLKLEMDLLKFKHNNHRFPKSYCSEPCLLGQAKLQLEGDTCCWLCTNCSQYQFLSDEFHCDECPLGTLPNYNKTKCDPVPTIHLSLTEWWTISSIIFASVGMMATIGTCFVFCKYAETPIIKASGRELSNLHLAGIFLSFAATFVIISKPTPLTCAMTRFFLGFCYTVCYSAIVTKTNRISRIFQHRSCKKPRFTSPRSQLIITTILISIEVIINIIWFFYSPPDIKYVYSTREWALLICSGSDHLTYLFGLIYPLILIGFCTVYAFKTRKCPEGFNEARYITFTNYTTCVVWFAFLPLYVMLSTTTPLRAITLSSLLSVSGAVQLFCLFVPKIYIAVLKPEKNTRETVMCGGHRSLLFNNHHRNLPSLLHHYHHHHHHHHHHRNHNHSNGGPIQQSKSNNDIVVVENSNSSQNDVDDQIPNQLSSKTVTRAQLSDVGNGTLGEGLILIEPYSTSSEVDTQTTATTNTKVIHYKNSVGSIVSMPDRLLLQDSSAKISPTNNLDENEIGRDRILAGVGGDMKMINSKIYSKRRPSSAGATTTMTTIVNNNISNSLLSNENHNDANNRNKDNNNKNGVNNLTAVPTSASTAMIMMMESSNSSSSSSSIQFPVEVANTTANNVSNIGNSNAIIKKHETKAVLENGHQQWPSIKLETSSSISSSATTATAIE